MGRKILWIEDDARELAPLLWPLEDEGYDIYVAEDAIKAVELLNKNTYDIILLDILIPTGQKDPSDYIEYTGVTIAEYIRGHKIDTPIIVLTVVSDSGIEKKLKELNVSKIISKGSVLPTHLKKEIQTILGDI
jgi:CheY-like chemotaxis protein